MNSVKLVLITLLVMTAGRMTAQSDAYFDLVGRADSAIMGNRWNDAELLLVEAMRLEPGQPSNVLLMSNLGIVRLNAGKDSLALDILNEAHRMAPVSVTVLSNRARVLQSMGRDAEAFYDYTLIIELDSMVVYPRFMRGMMALNGGDLVTAEKDFDMLKRIAPEEENTMVALAALYTATNRPLDAIVQYTRLVNREPMPEYYRGRAACYLMTDQLNEASADIAEWHALTPDDAELYIYRAYLNKKRFRNDDAEADLKRAIELGIDPARAALLR